MSLTVPVLREAFRHYQAWRSLYEAHEVDDTLVCQDGTGLSLWDVAYLIENLRMLPPRQREAIQFCFIENMKEADAAVRMGVSRTNPVSMYANTGLTRLLGFIREGRLPRFQENTEREAG